MTAPPDLQDSLDDDAPGIDDSGRDGSGDDLDPVDEDEPRRRWFQPPSAVQAVVFVVVVLLLGGALGWLLGSDSSDPDPSAVDVGFLQDMITHHEQAVELAEEAVGRGQSPVTRSFAEEVMFFQAREIGIMQTYLQDFGYNLEERPDTAMAWMDMEVPVEQMVGLVSDEQFAALHEAEGDEVDRQFIELMITHHQGGLHMAEEAADTANDPRVRDLAATMARIQAQEIQEYQVLQERLGFPVTGG